jgi:hypothetical protein
MLTEWRTLYEFRNYKVLELPQTPLPAVGGSQRIKASVAQAVAGALSVS